ncbi:MULTISPECIES: zinc-dependent alcohol dehydrogenase family protein [Variovorax]|nr:MULTISPECIES: zinc-dependent alcohol dehydrogenase family protein [Variovorax]MBN8758179.1 zinc-dependent alcohol dehydrogenase family protein [Variovorax sp.]ODU12858.1 MAG: alcohol dehydrogenase [Variovorax sp. SCN 67-85]ODV19644.1 MAG: alcohol dehydrogenase [Variovorax sp. SCN 67-20]OJZ06878.1 MAG: alcohol dehydrogenase [Variovorax sp. 67-131]UKI12001.1 zinc-dependent alcohol dehydrogenase family protein [Variovorax paradoxus]
MRAMVLNAALLPLEFERRNIPQPGPGKLLLRVLACAVCHTDLHIVDGELPLPVLPIVPGHEIVGIVEALGAGVENHRVGDRVGVPWLAHSCGCCTFCASGHENLCDVPRFTGYHRDGGFASHAIAEAAFCLPLSMPEPDAARIAPLLCAGLIGWRSLKAAGEEVRRLGIFGSGAAAHLMTQVATSQGREVLAFTRPGDTETQRFARSLGARWAGSSGDRPPDPLDAAIIFAPAGELVPAALRVVRKGGRVVCGGIHMSDIPAFAYRLLWEERSVVSVANLTRADAREFLDFAQTHPLQVHVRTYPLAQANEALADLRAGRIEGAAVLVP